jgi:hypothetical protein
MCLSFPRRPPWRARSSALRVGTGSTARKGNQWALDLEHLVLEVATKEPGQQRPEAWVVVEVIGEAVALHADALLDNIAEMDCRRGVRWVTRAASRLCA